MKNWSIVTKIILAACGIMLILLFVGSFIVMQFEIDLLDAFNVEYREKITASIDASEQELTTTLRKNVLFNAEILGETVAIHLYNYDSGELQKSLLSFMNYPEIRAVNVLNENSEMFSAAWKNPEITVGNELPEDFSVEGLLSVEVESVRDENLLGKLQVFYTDAVLRKKTQHVRNDASSQVEEFHRHSRSRLRGAIIRQSIGIGGILLALMLCLLVVLRMLVRTPLLKLSDVTHKLTAFDLTVDVKARNQDEAGKLLQAINQLVQSFRKVIGQVQRSGIRVTSSATELSATAKEQETIIAQQMDSTGSIVASVKEISDVAAHLVQTMQKVASMSQNTAEFVSSGQADLTRMKDVMFQMEKASESISGRLESIHKKTESITSVVTTITKVADQTNLLSLNAAIEAEKAGEYGRGFTVVAREIRRLADQTAVATLDIEQMVQDMQTAVATGVTEMDNFVAEVRRNAEDVSDIGAQLTQIIDQVRALSPNFEEVNLVMERQSEHVDKINTAMLDLSEEMQQTRDSLGETYSVIEQLKNSARNLQDEVSQFKVT